jgi:broad specificity phosphatase PhoE
VICRITFQNDPFLFDSCLSALGIEQVAGLTARVKELNLKPDLIISSPLSRALETAQAFSHLLDVRGEFLNA